MTMHDTYFIGYDAREHEAAAVAAYSIQRRATRWSRVYMIEHQALRHLGLFWRSWSVSSSGQFFDTEDERPFSTAFSHSRFLVFHLARELECKGPCMFVDCDWLFLSDTAKLMEQQEDNPHQIGVVMRDRKVAENSVKMDGMVQQNYPRKLWSALFTFMPSDDLADKFSPDTVNAVSGRDLHAFLDMPATEFWPIDPSWHYIPSLDPAPAKINGIHFSEFSPWLNPERGDEAREAFNLWHLEKGNWLNHASIARSLTPWDDLTAALMAQGLTRPTYGRI